MIETDSEEVRRWIAQAKSRRIGLKPVEIWLGQTDRPMGPVLAKVVKGLGIGGRFRTRATIIAKAAEAAEAVGREEKRLDAQGEHARVVLVGRRRKTATIAVSPGRYAEVDPEPWADTTVAERVEMALGMLDNMRPEEKALADRVGRKKGRESAPGVH
ncbi:MAG: hypothetical protein OXU81_07340 [Gammaproteobacteria bacterium]|nr:hypothetical protein [Gammaproteobacteria bacterium]